MFPSKKTLHILLSLDTVTFSIIPKRHNWESSSVQIHEPARTERHDTHIYHGSPPVEYAWLFSALFSPSSWLMGEMHTFHMKLMAEDGADRGQEKVCLSVFTLPVSRLIRRRHAETSTESVFIWSCTCHLKQRERSFWKEMTLEKWAW